MCFHKYPYSFIILELSRCWFVLFEIFIRFYNHISCGHVEQKGICIFKHYKHFLPSPIYFAAVLLSEFWRWSCTLQWFWSLFCKNSLNFVMFQIPEGFSPFQRSKPRGFDDKATNHSMWPHITTMGVHCNRWKWPVWQSFAD